MAMQPNGRGTQTNISDWQAYAKRNSFDPTESREQSQRDLAPVKAGERISDWSKNDWQGAPETGEGKGWRHWSEVSQRNSYTGKGGSKRD
jgi:hypothetical protein